MTVLLVLFLFLAFVATDQVVRAAGDRARRKRAASQAPPRPAPPPSALAKPLNG